MTPRIPGKALVVALLVAGAMTAGALVIAEARSTADPSPAAQAPTALPVETTVVEAKPVQVWTAFSARLQAVDQVELRPQVSGEIVDVRFRDGERVRRGDTLFVIDPRPYQAAVNEATAQLAAARERHEYAEKEYRRAKSLIGKGAIPERLHDERSNAYVVTRSEVAAAEARLRLAQVDLDHAYVKAPIAGRVSRAEITVGNLVQAGANAPLLTTIVSDDEIYADFEVDERTYLRFVQAGANNLEAEQSLPVKLQVGGEDGPEIDGRIHTFDNRLDPATGTIRARALFLRQSATLLPGMYARVRLGAAPAPSFVLSERAILTDQDRKFVYVVDAGGKAAYRQVTLGPSVEGKRVIASGLSAGERVVTSNLMMVRPGMPVAARDGQTAAAR